MKSRGFCQNFQPVRGFVAKIHSLGALTQSADIRSLVDPVLGPDAQLVRSILFNKSNEANWQVAWHQDLAIAVVEKATPPSSEFLVPVREQTPAHCS